jgi:hypothetical protein
VCCVAMLVSSDASGPLLRTIIVHSDLAQGSLRLHIVQTGKLRTRGQEQLSKSAPDVSTVNWALLDLVCG